MQKTWNLRKIPEKHEKPGKRDTKKIRRTKNSLQKPLKKQKNYDIKEI